MRPLRKMALMVLTVVLLSCGRALLYQPRPDHDIRYALAAVYITKYLFGISAPATAINFAILHTRSVQITYRSDRAMRPATVTPHGEPVLRCWRNRVM